jgi:hypothetical protein
MSNLNKLKSRDKAIVDIFLGVLSERDEGISQTIKSMDDGIKKAVNQISFGFAVLQKALESLGVTPEQLEQIAVSLSGGKDNETAEKVYDGSSENDPSSSEEVSGDHGERGEENFSG